VRGAGLNTTHVPQTHLNMTQFVVRGISSDLVDAIRSGGPDANGQTAIAQVSRGPGDPCRHCLRLIDDGEDKLILSYRPFSTLQPYAEVGPIFLHRKSCQRYEAEELPAWFSHLQPALIRGYGQDDWIRYETGQVVPGTKLSEACREILAREDVSYVHIRSKFNCFQCRVDQGWMSGRGIGAA